MDSECKFLVAVHLWTLNIMKSHPKTFEILEKIKDLKFCTEYFGVAVPFET